MSNYQNNKTTSSGVGFPIVVTVVFVILKLVGVINWSWWWVLAPTWISLGLGLALILITVLCTAIVRLIDKRKRGKK